MFKSKIINQSIRLLGRIWNWLAVEQPVEKYTARLVAEVGRGNGYEGRLGAVFQGEDGRVFYSDIVNNDITENYVREIFPKDFTPALTKALNGKFRKHKKGWILSIPFSRGAEPVADPTIIAALKWAWHPYPEVAERPYKPLEGEDLERGLAMARPYLDKICIQCGIGPLDHKIA